VRLLIGLLLCLLSTPVFAQDQEGPKCLPMDQMETTLAAEFNETRVAQGIRRDGRSMILVYVSPNGESWTVVIVSASDQMACVADYGGDWQVRNDTAPVPETAL
jgi:hypothetical protein